MTEFARRLIEWQAAEGWTQRALASRIGCHESRLSQLRGGEAPGADLMRHAIAAAPEPWRSALKQARSADQEVADAAVVAA